MAAYSKTQSVALLGNTDGDAGRAVSAIFVAIVCLFPSSCSNHTPSKAIIADISNLSDLASTTVFDSGTLIAGQTLRHRFSLRNTGTHSVAVLSDADLIQGCGCSDLQLEHRKLAPGESTTATVIIRTEGKKGPFYHVGTVNWTAADGSKPQSNLGVRGVALRPIDSTPEILLFAEWKERQIERDFVLTANVPVDWQSLSVSSSVPQVEVLSSRVSGDSVVCRVKARAVDNQDTLSGQLTITAKQLADASAVADSAVLLSVPIQFQNCSSLSVVPRSLSLLIGAQNEYSGRLLIRSAGLAQDSAFVRSVTCEGYQIRWSLTEPSAGNSAVLRLTFKPNLGIVADTRDLVLEFADHSQVRLPIVFVRPGSADQE